MWIESIVVKVSIRCFERFDRGSMPWRHKGVWSVPGHASPVLGLQCGFRIHWDQRCLACHKAVPLVQQKVSNS